MKRFISRRTRRHEASTRASMNGSYLVVQTQHPLSGQGQNAGRWWVSVVLPTPPLSAIKLMIGMRSPPAFDVPHWILANLSTVHKPEKRAPRKAFTRASTNGGTSRPIGARATFAKTSI